MSYWERFYLTESFEVYFPKIKYKVLNLYMYLKLSKHESKNHYK